MNKETISYNIRHVLEVLDCTLVGIDGLPVPCNPFPPFVFAGLWHLDWACKCFRVAKSRRLTAAKYWPKSIHIPMRIASS